MKSCSKSIEFYLYKVQCTYIIYNNILGKLKKDKLVWPAVYYLIFYITLLFIWHKKNMCTCMYNSNLENYVDGAKFTSKSQK